MTFTTFQLFSAVLNITHRLLFNRIFDIVMLVKIVSLVNPDLLTCMNILIIKCYYRLYLYRL